MTQPTFSLVHRPDGSGALDAFAAPLLARIGPHNVRRLPSAAAAVALELASLFTMQISVPVDEAPADRTSDLPRVPAGTVVALYSLMEQAADRAAGILRRRHPGLEVLILSDHVASDRLRSIARSADLLVVVDRAAKHAATEALKAARGSGLTRYAAGKGATSLVEATEAGLGDLASATPHDPRNWTVRSAVDRPGRTPGDCGCSHRLMPQRKTAAPLGPLGAPVRFRGRRPRRMRDCRTPAW